MPPTPPASGCDGLQPRYPRGFKRSRTLEWACDRERDSFALFASSNSTVVTYRDDELEEGASTSSATTGSTTDDEMEVFTPLGGSFVLPDIVVSPAEEFSPHSEEETSAAAILVALRNLGTK